MRMMLVWNVIIGWCRLSSLPFPSKLAPSLDFLDPKFTANPGKHSLFLRTFIPPLSLPIAALFPEHIFRNDDQKLRTGAALRISC